MNFDKQTLNKLKKYSQVFCEARGREANESDTVMYLIKFFEDVLGYDSLSGEISKEIAIKDRYCDFGIKLNGSFQFLVEAKAAGNKTLRDKDIEQAENYASRTGLKWVLLTNGIEWKLFHLTFNDSEGITHDEVFSVNIVDDFDKSPEAIWNCIGLLSKESIKKNELSEYLDHKKALSPASLVRILFSPDVLITIRRELNRNSEVRLEIEDVFEAIKNVISKDALLDVGDINLKKKRKKRKKVSAGNATNIIETEEDIDETSDENDTQNETTQE